MKEKAENFASWMKQLLKDNNKSQRQIATSLGISHSAMNRLCVEGTGSDDHVCQILEYFGYNRRPIIEILAERRAELSTGKAKRYWEKFKYAYLNEEEFLCEICPFPFKLAFALTHLGIPIQEARKLAKQIGIQDIQNISKMPAFKLFKFADVFEKEYGKDMKNLIFGAKSSEYPPVLLFNFLESKDAAEYIHLANCNGRLFFGLPHLVLGDYIFEPNGIICNHKNTGGIELLYSIEGTFELTCQGKTSQSKLTPRGSILIYNAKTHHEIKLIESSKGRLLMARYYPQTRAPRPGRPRRKRIKRLKSTVD